MLFEYLAHVRSQPKEARQRFALFVTVVVTASISLLWLSTFFLGRLDTDTESVSSESTPRTTLLERLGIFTKQVHEDMGLPFDSPIGESEQVEGVVSDTPLKNTFLALPVESAEETSGTSTEVLVEQEEAPEGSTIDTVPNLVE
jgi:hypothetical protein